MKNSELAICFSANKTYLPHFTVACYSFLKNNPGEWNLVLMSDDVKESDLLKIRNCLFTVSPKSILELIVIDKNSLTDLIKGPVSRHGVQTYYRLLLADSLPAHINMALYFDSDLIVYQPIDINFKSFKNNPIAGVTDFKGEETARIRGIKNYYNAGVILLNLKIWRDENLTDLVFNFSPKYTDLNDQDLLNEFFYERWGSLSSSMNCHTGKVKRNTKGFFLNQGKKPIVLHFIGPGKPWKYWSTCSPLYWNYLIKTPYWYQAYKIPSTILRKVIYKLYKAIRSGDLKGLRKNMRL